MNNRSFSAKLNTNKGFVVKVNEKSRTFSPIIEKEDKNFNPKVVPQAESEGVTGTVIAANMDSNVRFMCLECPNLEIL